MYSFHRKRTSACREFKTYYTFKQKGISILCFIARYIVQHNLVDTMSATSTSIGAMHATGSSSLDSIYVNLVHTLLSGIVLTLTAGRCVKDPFNFNMAPENLSPRLVLRRWWWAGAVRVVVAPYPWPWWPW